MPDHLGNFLGIYNPITKEQVKSLTQMPHRRGGYGSTVPMYSSWGSWDAAISGRFEGSNIDYAARVGDLSKSSLIMSAVRVVGNTLPEAPLEVKDPGDGTGDATVIAGHALLDLLRKPNPYYAGDSLWTAFAYSWIVDGNVYLVKVRNKAGTKVVELWYEPHWSIRPRWYGDNQGGIELREGDDRSAFILYYELDRGTQKYRLEVDDVVHFRDGNDPVNQRVGWSYIRSVYREIYGDNEVSNFSSRLMGGSAVPPFFVEVDTTNLEVDQDDAEALALKLERKTTGDNKGKPIVVFGGKPHKLAWSPSDIDLKMLHRFSEERFSAVTGIDPIMTGLGVGHDHSIYNNVAEGRQAYYEAYLKPLYRRIATQINLQLLPDFEPDSKLYTTHDLSKISALQESEDLKHKRVWGDFTNGMITRKQAKSLIGVDPEEDGSDDVYMIRTGVQLIPAGKLPPTQSSDTQPLQLVKSLRDNLPQGWKGATLYMEKDGKLEPVEIKSVPSDKEVQEAVDWLTGVNPALAELVKAEEKKPNGDGKVIA
jgi:HK97 family phage portal protein